MILSYWAAEVPKNLDTALARLSRVCFEVRDAIAGRYADIDDMGHLRCLIHRGGRDVMAFVEEDAVNCVSRDEKSRN